MRVLYLSDNQSDHNRRFVEAAIAEGHQVWFLDITAQNPRERWPGVRYVQTTHPLPRNASPEEAAGLLRELLVTLKDIDPDLVHAGPVPTCGYLAALSGFHPLIVTSWGSDLLVDAHRGPDWNHATAYALGKADGFFCDGNAVRKVARQFASIPEENIVQFPWGIKRGSFKPVGPLPPELHVDADAIPIICTRSWEPLYDVDVLLRAFAIAYRREPRLRLLLLGNGSESDRIHAFIAEQNLASAVITPRIVSPIEMPAWFRAAKVYASCARSDGTSVSLLEAMATGLPVIVTDIAPNREWVVDGENGWLAPAGMTAQFAEKMLIASALSVRERELISHTNRRVVEERADWDRNIGRLFAMYDALVELQKVVAR